MKKIYTALATLAVNATALASSSTNVSLTTADTTTADTVKNKPQFTVIKEIPITSIKDQSRSGTCWDYSTLSFFEAEILRKTGKTYDLAEMFVANKNYMDRAVMTVRLHGDMQFEQGGSAYDVLYVLKNYGICPEDAMPLPGTMYGDTLNNFSEFFKVMPAYVKAIASSDMKKLSPAWQKGLKGIIEAYLGSTPESFSYEGKKYTPQTFATSLGLNWNDYVSITSYTHHPFWTEFPVEVQDNWRQGMSWNLPMEDMKRVIDNAIEQGYTVAWGGDVSEDGFTRDGLALLVDTKKVVDAEGSDMAKWLKLSSGERKEKIQKLGVDVPELTPSQDTRQTEFDNWTLTDDHGMLIYGVAKDQTGREYYMVKNSWGKTGDYKGIWYMSKNFIIAKTMDFLVNKNALPNDIKKKLNLK